MKGAVVMSLIDESLFETLHLDPEEVSWAPMSPGMEQRIIHARPEEGFLVNVVRAQPGVISVLHRHLGPGHGYTISGKWGHDPKCEYLPGHYIFETPGVPHRFYNGTGVTELIFVNHGSLEVLDQETGDVVALMTQESMIEGYFTACESAGLPRPNILT